jgi:hypothetical protein
MNNLIKLAGVATLAGAMALTALAPANAAVSVGIGIGVPGPAPVRGHHWCHWHPRACGYGPGYVGVPVVGTFYAGRGWWDGHSWYHNRFRDHGGWRYR